MLAVVAMVAMVAMMVMLAMVVMVAVLLTKMRLVLKHKFSAESTFLGTTICDRHHRVTSFMTSRSEASIAELQRNIEITASASVVTSVEPSLLSTSDTNIATATSNSSNSTGPFSRLPTRSIR
ncbi:hypothetical protein F4703DRAFT_1790537 [Phycomyces blakesleeanus]